MTNSNNHQDILPQVFNAGPQGYTYPESAQDLHWFFIPYGSFEKLLGLIEGREFHITPIIEDMDTLQRLNALQVEVYQLACILGRYSLLVKPIAFSPDIFRNILTNEGIIPLARVPSIVGVECPRTYAARVWFHKHHVKHVL